MISTRRYLEALRHTDRERAFTFFSIALAVAAFTWNELGRRLSDIAEDTVHRREYEDQKFAHLDSSVQSIAERAAGAAEAAKLSREQREEGWKPREHLIAISGAVAGLLLVIVTVVAYHPW